MKTYIAFLRGINVGGHRKILMAELKTLLSELNFETVKTYIQSGNIVFQSKESSTKDLEKNIQQAIRNHFNFEIMVLVKSYIEFQNIVSESPFQNIKLEKSYFMLLSAEPTKKDVIEISKLSSSTEEFYIKDNCIYFFSENGYGRAKYNSNFFERKLKINITARNYKTMLKLLAIAEEVKIKA